MQNDHCWGHGSTDLSSQQRGRDGRTWSGSQPGVTASNNKKAKQNKWQEMSFIIQPLLTLCSWGNLEKVTRVDTGCRESHRWLRVGWCSSWGWPWVWFSCLARQLASQVHATTPIHAMPESSPSLCLSGKHSNHRNGSFSLSFPP